MERKQEPEEVSLIRHGNYQYGWPVALLKAEYAFCCQRCLAPCGQEFATGAVLRSSNAWDYNAHSILVFCQYFIARSAIPTFSFLLASRSVPRRWGQIRGITLRNVPHAPAVLMVFN
jgi:hypothetical protein